MLETLQKIYDLSRYKSKLEQQSAKFVYVTLTVMFVIITAYIFFVPDVADGQLTWVQDALNGSALTIIILVLFYSLCGVVYYLTRSGNYVWGGIGLSIVWYVFAIVPVFFNTQNMVHPSNAMSLSILIILSGLTLYERGLIIGTVVAFFTLLINFDPQLITQVPILLSQLLGISLVVFIYIRYAKVNRIEGAEVATQERLKLADITTQLSSLTLSRPEMVDMLRQGLDLIQGSYPQFYHAQIFLLDEAGRKAQLVSSTGEAGRTLIQREHSIGVGSQSVIGQATLRNTHIVARANDDNTIHQRNDFLPDTVLEVAFPLRVGQQVIGALDLQSTQKLSLPDDEIVTYQSLANSFALAIDNIRQFEIAEAQIQNNQQLAIQAQQSLQEIDRLNKRLLEQAWADYLMSQKEQIGLNIDFKSNTVESSDTWSTALQQAMDDENLVQTAKDNDRLIAIPLKVRGQVIGAMEFELDEAGTIDPADLSLIQEVSERFGLAAENTRLVEESQRIAQREALINEIGSRLQTTNNVESTLTEAARSLNSVLNANRISIKLRQLETDLSDNGLHSS